MHTTSNLSEQQQGKQLQHRISSFMGNFQIGSMLHDSGMRKRCGAAPVALFTALFSLPFWGQSFSQGIVHNSKVIGFGKDAAYDFLKNPRHNWRRFMLRLVTLVIRCFDVLTDTGRERVLIVDDSTYDRSRAKAVELLSWVRDHNAGKSLKGFKLLTLGWSDGVSFIPLDFILFASSRLVAPELVKKFAGRCCGAIRRKEALTKSTEQLEGMIKRVLALGIRADYLLMDSWFSFPSLLAQLGEYLPVICMGKNMPNVKYGYQGSELTLSGLYRRLRKKPGQAKLLASALVTSKTGQKLKIVFVRHRRKKRTWLAILSTKVDLPDEEIVRIYGKRWDIEVFFKMLKHYLKLERETQLRDFDGIIAHVTITMTRYIFLTVEQRRHDDPRTLGALFQACCDELEDLSLSRALERLLTLAVTKLQVNCAMAGDAILAIVDSIMDIAIDILQSGTRLHAKNIVYSAG